MRERPDMRKGTGILPIMLLSMFTAAFAGFDETWFLFSNEFYGKNAYTDPQAVSNIRNTLANTLTFHPPISSGMEQLLTGNHANLIFEEYGSTSAGNEEGNPLASFIDSQRTGLAQFTLAAPSLKTWWSPMKEVDQSGGAWANPRPDYTGLTRQQAYSAFHDFFLSIQHAPLGGYLRQTHAQLGVNLMAWVDYPCNVAYFYEYTPVDMCIIERSIDELSDLSTGLPFIRGASRQYDKPWGIDVSTWRTETNAATTFDANGTLLGGWSPSYLSRIMYGSYFNGANVVQIEATIYGSGSTYNPFGAAVKEFCNFALVRHRDVGRPLVNMAFMLDFYNGFDAKHWRWCQNNAVWYQQIPYSDGDYMINNLFKAAYPGHWLQGLTPNAPFSDAAGYAAYLAGGGDPRPYEPMSTTRYGNNLDIILNNASAAALARYKVIMLAGGIAIDNTTRPLLLQWVQNGGLLVANVKQITKADESFLGVTLTTSTAVASSSKWITDGIVEPEQPFTYTKVTPTTATVIADNNGADALITRNAVGSGLVILTTPHYLQNNAKDTLLRIGMKLMDTLDAYYAGAKISGPPVSYTVNTGAGKTVVMLVNNNLSAATWNGTIAFNKPQGTFTTKEWRADETVSNTVQGNTVNIPASVPAFDIKVYAMEYPTTGTALPSKSKPPVFSVTPGRNGLSISSNEPSMCSYAVYDMKGRKMISHDGYMSAGSLFIAPAHLHGTYMIIVKRQAELVVKKLITLD